MFVSFRAVVLISVSELALLGAVLSAEVVQSPPATGQTVTQSQEGDVRSGFPPTNGAAMKTVYLDDEDVIRMKTTWKKLHFAIEVNPSAERREDARRREAARSALRNK